MNRNLTHRAFFVHTFVVPRYSFQPFSFSCFYPNVWFVWALFSWFQLAFSKWFGNALNTTISTIEIIDKISDKFKYDNKGIMILLFSTISKNVQCSCSVFMWNNCLIFGFFTLKWIWCIVLLISGTQFASIHIIVWIVRWSFLTPNGWSVNGYVLFLLPFLLFHRSFCPFRFLNATKFWKWKTIIFTFLRSSFKCKGKKLK